MPGIELSIDFYDEDTAAVRVSSSATHDQERQLELLLFCLFAARQLVNLGDEVSWQLDEALKAVDSSPDRLLELADQGLGSLSIVPHPGDAGNKRFAASLSCGPSFDLGPFNPADEGEEIWIGRARDWAISFEMAPHGFGLLGRGVNYYAPTSVLVLLTDLAQRRQDDIDFIERLAYSASEIAHHGFTITNQVPMATFVAQMCWSGKFCPECEKAVDRALERCPDCGHNFYGLSGADEVDEEDLKRETTDGAHAGLGDPLLLEDSYSKLRLEITPLELRDPAYPDDEEPEDGHRFVALRTKVRNRTRRPTDEISTIDAALVDQRGRRYEPEPVVLPPDFDEIESLDAGESASGWLVFSLPRSALPSAFRYQAGIGETGEWELARETEATVGVGQAATALEPENEAAKSARAMQILLLIETGQLASPRIKSLWKELNRALEDKEKAERKAQRRGSLADAMFDPDSDYSRASARHSALYEAIVAEGERALAEHGWAL